MKQKPERYLIRWVCFWVVLIMTISSIAGYLGVIAFNFDNVIYVEKVILSYITNDMLYVFMTFWMNALLFLGEYFLSHLLFLKSWYIFVHTL